MDQLTLKLPWASLMEAGGGGPRGRARPAVFVAYRFDNHASRQLRKELQDAAEQSGDVDVLDGHVEPGDHWAPEVRKRIKRSRLIVADVTGPSREVLFEMGFAGNKPLFPVIDRAHDRGELPSWVTIDQIAAYGGTGIAQVVDGVLHRARDPVRKPRRQQRPSPVPGHVVWLQGRGSEWASSARVRFENLAREGGLAVVHVAPEDLYSSEDLREHLRAWVVVGCIDGGSHDYAAHFFFGDIIGRLRAGSGTGAGQSLSRVAIVFAPTRELVDDLVADSVRRVERDHIRLIATQDELLHEAKRLFSRYRKWLNAGSE